MTFRITQGDTSPSFLSQLSDGNVPIDLTGFQEVRFIMENRFEEKVLDKDTSDSPGVNIINAKTGDVEVVFTQGETDTAGMYKAEWEVTYGNGAVETFPTGEKIDVEIVEEID